MPISVGDILRRAQTALNDTAGTRWPLTELLRYVNDCPREISILAPEILAESGVVSLVEGPLQSLPSDAYSLIRVVCNMTGTSPNFTRGRAVTPIKRLMLDQHIPGWQQNSVVPYTSLVSHLIEDDQSHRTFMVFPGNSGTGKIEIVVARRVANVSEPGSPTVITSYDSLSINLDAAYLPAVADYVVYRAYQKDMAIPAAASASSAAYQRFAAALGVKLQSEARASTNSQKMGT